MWKIYLQNDGSGHMHTPSAKLLQNKQSDFFFLFYSILFCSVLFILFLKWWLWHTKWFHNPLMDTIHCLKNTGLEMKDVGNKAAKRNISITQEKDNGNLILGWAWGRGKSWQGCFNCRDSKEERAVRKKCHGFCQLL